MILYNKDMPRPVNIDELENIKPQDLTESASMVLKSINNSKTNYNRYNSVFISYSSKDFELLPAVIKILQDHGGTPYVDKKDSRLPNNPNKDTAKILKSTIINTNKLVVFVTSNTKDSRWVPWELGVADGAKDNNRIAIFPATKGVFENHWYEQEYFGLYKQIVWGKLENYDSNVWMVYNHENNTATELSKWLKE